MTFFLYSEYRQISIALTDPTLLCLKFVSRRMQCAVKILEDLTEGNSRKSQIKPEIGIQNNKKNICLGSYNSRPEPKILTDMTVE